MSKITITEALAEIPTIEKRIHKKQEFVTAFLFRQSLMRDPHEKDGGSSKLIAEEMQAIKDLNARRISIRSAIQAVNAKNEITIGKTTRTISDWLTWRREIAQGEQSFLQTISNQLRNMRQQAQQKSLNVTDKDTGATTDIVVNINEKDLSEKIEQLESDLGVLDGLLSLKNATITIDI